MHVFLGRHKTLQRFVHHQDLGALCVCIDINLCVYVYRHADLFEHVDVEFEEHVTVYDVRNKTVSPLREFTEVDSCDPCSNV